MKITDVQLRQYRWERGAPIRNGMHIYTHSGLNLLRIETDAGISGIGWAHKPQTLGMAKVAQGLLEHFKPMLIGEDPFNYRRIWQQLWSAEAGRAARHHHAFHQRHRYCALGSDGKGDRCIRAQAAGRGA